MPVVLAGDRVEGALLPKKMTLRATVIDAQDFVPDSCAWGTEMLSDYLSRPFFAYAPGRALNLSYTFCRYESFSLLVSLGVPLLSYT